MLMFISVFILIFGLLREITVGYFFGTSASLDATLIGLTLPLAFGTEFAMISHSVLIPQIESIKSHKGYLAAIKAFIHIFFIALSSAVLISLLLSIFSTQLVSLLAPGLTSEASAIAVETLKYFSPISILIGTTGFLRVFLEIHGKLQTTPVSRCILQLTVILTIATFSNLIGIVALPIGIATGWCLFIISQIFSARKLLLNLSRPVGNPFKALVHLPTWEILFVTSNSAITQISRIAERYFASFLIAGSIAALNYSHMVFNALLLLFAQPIGTAIFPRMSNLSADHDKKGFRKLLLKSSGLITVIIIPSAAFIAYFSSDIVRIAFERGAFDANSTSLTSTALSVHAIGLPFFALNHIFRHAIVSQKKSFSLLVSQGCGFIGKIILMALLLSHFEIVAISGAHTLGAIIVCILQATSLKRIMRT